MGSLAAIQRHEEKEKASQLAKVVLQAQRDPIWFAEEVLQLKYMEGDKVDSTGHGEWELDQWQKDLLNAVADVWRKQQGLRTVINHEGKPWITMRAMHGPGKTFGMAVVDHYFNFCFKGRIFATAPKLKQVTTQLFPEFRKVLNRSVEWYRSLIDVQATTVRWCGDPDWSLLPDSAQSPENMAGKHWDYVLINVDEASGVDEALWPVVYGILSVGKILIMLCISNPTKNIGTFADQHLKPALAQDYFRFHISLDKTRRVRRDWVDKMIRKYGKDSPVVKVRCYGEFPGDSPNQLIAMQWIADANAKDVDPIIGDGSRGKLRISIDCGAGGSGETVCTAARQFASVRVGLRQTANSYPLATASIQTADEGERLFTLFGGNKDEDDFVVDSLGVGVGAAGILISRGYRVVTYQGGAASDDQKRWRCRRVQSYINARNDLRDGCVAFADDFFVGEDAMEDQTEFEAQLCSIQSPEGSERVEDLMTKKQMTEQGLPSPDKADSWVMQYATQAPTTVPNNMKVSNDEVAVNRSTISMEDVY